MDQRLPEALHEPSNHTHLSPRTVAQANPVRPSPWPDREKLNRYDDFYRDSIVFAPSNLTRARQMSALKALATLQCSSVIPDAPLELHPIQETRNQPRTHDSIDYFETLVSVKYLTRGCGDQQV